MGTIIPSLQSRHSQIFLVMRDVGRATRPVIISITVAIEKGVKPPKNILLVKCPMVRPTMPAMLPIHNIIMEALMAKK